MQSVFFITAAELGPMRTALYRFLELKLSRLADWDLVLIDHAPVGEDRIRLVITFWEPSAAREFEQFAAQSVARRAVDERSPASLRSGASEPPRRSAGWPRLDGRDPGSDALGALMRQVFTGRVGPMIAPAQQTL